MQTYSEINVVVWQKSVFLSLIVVESLSSKLEWDLAQVLCFRSLLLSHKTISGQQRSYVARSVAMQSECNLNSSERGVLCRIAKEPYKEKAHTRRGRTSTSPLPPRRKRALPTWWQRRCNENTFNNSCTYRQYRS